METTMNLYLLAVYETGEGEDFIRTSNIAKRLGFKPSSVTEAFQKLSAQGFLEYIPYRGVKLTDRGKKIADKIIARQNTLRRLLLYMGLPKDLAETECKKLEPAITEEAISYIRAFLKNQKAGGKPERTW